jgi:hypothetical protein
MDAMRYIEAYVKDHAGDYDDDDDYKDVPVNMQEDIGKCILKTVFPDVLSHLKNFGYHEISGVEINHVSLQLLGEFSGSLEKAFNKEQRCYLYVMYLIFLLWEGGFCKKDGKQLVGAAIRLSKAIGKEEHVEELKQIVKDCFIPNEELDEDDEYYVHPWYLL